VLDEMTGRLKEAVRCYADAQPLLDEVLRREPQHATARRYLAVNHGARAETLTLLGCHAEAIEEWDLGLSLDARPARQAEFRGHRALNLAHLGDHARARADVEELAAAKTVSGSLLYTLACASATCSVAALRDSRLGEVEQKKVAEQDAARAVELLARANAGGYFRVPGRVEPLQQEDDLKPLQARADYLKLLDGLKVKPKDGR
jgi:tetratricopeptide (TPR) repeat protein